MKKNDFILILAITAFALLGFIVLKTYNSDKGNMIRILTDGKEYAVYPLNEDREIKIKFKEKHNLVCIKNGEAYMKEADCPDGYCIKQGRISKKNETIICLPHKIVIEVINDNNSKEKNDVDTVTK